MALMSSLLDKLIDSDPTTKEERDFPATRADLIAGLLRDLESMLNSRIGWEELDIDLAELRDSIPNYGLPDFSNMPYSSKDGQNRLCSTVYRAIKDFEPRLTNPRVRIADTTNTIDRTLRLEIRATCLIDKDIHEVRFNSDIEPVNLCVKLSRAK